MVMAITKLCIVYAVQIFVIKFLFSILRILTILLQAAYVYASSFEILILNICAIKL